MRTNRRRISGDERQRIWEEYGGVCGLCGQCVEFLVMHLDHIRPLHLGGSDVPANLRPSHAECNIGRRYFVRRPKTRASDVIGTFTEEERETYREMMREIGSKGGTARAKALTPGRRLEIARKASAAREARRVVGK